MIANGCRLRDICIVNNQWFQVGRPVVSQTAIHFHYKLTRDKQSVTQWYNIGLMIERSRIQVSPTALPMSITGKLLSHTCLCHQAV